jgi:hypothetical protein
MIVQWRKSGTAAFTARWNGLELKLVCEPCATGEGPWRLYVDGKLVRQRWFTPSAAMSAIEAVQTRLILAQSVVVRALQRPMEARHA